MKKNDYKKIIIATTIVILWCSSCLYMSIYWDTMTMFKKIFLSFIAVMIAPTLSELAFPRK